MMVQKRLTVRAKPKGEAVGMDVYSNLKPKPELTKKELDAIIASSPDPENGKELRKRATSEAVALRRSHVHRLLLRGVERQTMADYLGVTIDTIYSDCKFINANLKREMQELDYTLYIGSSVAFYEEVRNLALRMATNPNEKSKATLLRALTTALQAEDSKHSFLAKIGLYKTINPSEPFNSVLTGREGQKTDGADLDRFMELLPGLLDGSIQLPELVQGIDPNKEEIDVEGQTHE